MKRIGMLLVGVAALGLAACGDSGSGATVAEHAACKDVAAASEYVQKVSAEIAQATAAGKITAEQAQKAGDKMRAEMNAGVGENAPERGPGYMCNVMDSLKKELGI